MAEYGSLSGTLHIRFATAVVIKYTVARSEAYVCSYVTPESLLDKIPSFRGMTKTGCHHGQSNEIGPSDPGQLIPKSNDRTGSDPLASGGGGGHSWSKSRSKSPRMRLDKGQDPLT